jgi:hypothetical protein
MNVAPIARERSFVLGVTEDHDDRNLVRAGRQRLPMHAIEERLIRYVRPRLKRDVRRFGPKRVVRMNLRSSQNFETTAISVNAGTK